MSKAPHNPNPKGKAGNPITLPPMSFEEAVKKMLGTPPPKDEPKGEAPAASKQTAKRSAKKRGK